MQTPSSFSIAYGVSQRGLGAAALRSMLAASAELGIRVVVVGGANTATEAAGEIKATYPRAEVTMVSRSRAGDFKKGLRLERIARAELRRLGVRLIDGQTITEVRRTDVVTASGEIIPADICVWAGGLRATSVAKDAGLAVDEQDRIWVDPTLSSISQPHIVAIGDAIHPIAPTGAGYRMSAFAAIISGAYAARRIVDETRGRRPRPFSFSAYGQGVAIGRSGVGFFTFPNDGRARAILRGAVALQVRNLFVWFLVFFLKLKRRYPGSSPFWIGRRRVSWKRAREALRNAPEAFAASDLAPDVDLTRAERSGS
jgi:NADH dehydrogenase